MSHLPAARRSAWSPASASGRLRSGSWAKVRLPPTILCIPHCTAARPFPGSAVKSSTSQAVICLTAPPRTLRSLLLPVDAHSCCSSAYADSSAVRSLEIPICCRYQIRHLPAHLPVIVPVLSSAAICNLSSLFQTKPQS